MRAFCAFMVLLFCLTGARAQAIVEKMSAPNVLIGGVGWSFPSERRPSAPARERLNLEVRHPDASRLLDWRNEPIEDRYPPSFPVPPTLPAQSPKLPKAVVGYYVEVKNTGLKVINIIEWELTVIDTSEGKPYLHLLFRTEGITPPGKGVAHRQQFPLDEKWRRFNRDMRRKSAKVLIKVTKVMYKDGSEWQNT